MIMKANKQIGFIYKDNESIDKILKDGDVVFEKGFLREKTSTTLPITFGGVGKDLKDYKIYGNTYQNSTRGNQLIDFIKYTTKSNFITTFSFENDILILNQTQQGTFVKVNYDVTQLIKTNQNKTLKFSYKNMDTTHFDSASGTIIQLVIDKSGTRTYKTILNSSGITSQYEIPSNTDDITEAYINIYTNNSSTSTSASSVSITEPLLYFDDNSEYEPYTGGQPSPNPDYPQEIISCGDKTKNLIDINLSQSTSNATKSVDGNNLTITCNANNQNCYVSYDTSNINPNKTYYFSYTAVADNYAGVMIRAYKNDNTYEVVVDFTQTTEANLNFNVPDTTVYLTTFLYASRLTTGGSIGDKTIYSNVHLGEDPYGYKIPVNVRSDNLFDKDNANINNWLIKNSTHAIDANSNERCIICKVKPNTTYTIKKMATNRLRLGEYPTIPTTSDILNNYKNNDNSDNLTTTTLPDTNYLIINIVNVSNQKYNLQDTLDSIIIVEGSTAPSKYIPYYNEITNIYLDEPLRKINEYSDYIDFINGKVVRNIKEVVLDGSENWASASASGNYSRFVCNAYNDALIPIDLNTIGNILSDKFIPRTANETANAITGIAIAGSGRFVIYYDLTKDYTTTQFKTWLSSNNITVDYALSTPTEETITLPNIPTIDGNNTLNIETEITPSQVYIKYKSNKKGF